MDGEIVNVHLLESEAQHGDLLAGDGVEHGVDHALHKALLLVVIDLDHLQHHHTASSDTCSHAHPRV